MTIVKAEDFRLMPLFKKTIKAIDNIVSFL